MVSFLEEAVPSVLMTLLFGWMVYVLLSILLSFKDSKLRLARGEQLLLDADAGGGMEDEGEEEGGEEEEESEDDEVEREGEAEVGEEGKSGIAEGGEVEEEADVLLHSQPERPSDSPEKFSAPSAAGGCREDADGEGGGMGSATQGDEKREGATGSAPAVNNGAASGVIAGGGPVSGERERGGDEEEEEDDWEGVESSELEDDFHSAAAFVAAQSMAGRSSSMGEEKQLLLYGLYKQATEGACTLAQPGFFNLKGRKKWDAWKARGEESKEEAMAKYITVVREQYPELFQEKSEEEGSKKHGSGPLFSSLAQGEEAGGTERLLGVHHQASTGDVEGLRLYLKNGGDVNAQDEEGLAPIHWAVDRGHGDVVKLLLENGANPNLQDKEGQSPLHYAAICERKEIAKQLLEVGADATICDSEGSRPSIPPSWDLL